VTLITACGAASCVPLQDLDDYRSSPPVRGVALPDGENDAGAGSVTPAPVGTGASSEQPVSPTGPLSGAPLGPSGSELGGSGEAEPEALERSDAGASAEVDAGGASACGVGEQLGPNGRCYFFESSLTAWSTAREACLARGSGWDLTSVRSAADAQFLGEMLTIEAWIGGTDAANEGTWSWVSDGSTFWLGGVDGVAANGAFTNWNATEPNGATTTNCARALPRGPASSNPDAPWADLDCAQLLGAVCEGPPP
jgi:hypothetical protein